MATTKATSSVDMLFTQASLLPLDDRARLADLLLSSLNQVPLSPAWELEIDRRLAAYDNGQTQTVSGEQVVRSLKEKYGG